MLVARECLRYSLSLPIASLVVEINRWRDLEQDVKIARSFKPMTKPEKERLLVQAKDVASAGRYELFKSTQKHDGHHHRIQHGFATD